ncbi:uncharacterized protein LOC143035703 isoform X3 [Oratosquilla oratoria]|uniref:uncharacterized protein LOC143035703 isoform X3 n=1 Tax=Oratosquilla oratoria TaxID=337810 RepID=UPI003F76F87F
MTGVITSLSARMRMAGVEVGKTTGSHECGGCGKRISDRYLLKAVDLYWHEDCLKCGCCDCRLGEVGSTLYKKANLLLCKRDYLRLFGTTGHCAACNKVIPAFEMVMRAKTNVYHLECFACQQCNHRFCVGDRFYLCDNKILCAYDYEERLVFANMSYSSDSLAHIKRQVSDLQQPQDEVPSGRTQRGLPHAGPSQPQLHQQPQHGGGAPMPLAGAPQPQQQQQQPQPPPQPPQPIASSSSGLGFSTAGMSAGAVPGTSGMLLGGGDALNGGGGGLVGPGAGGADDASSGYGSPDSMTLDER